MAIPESIHSEIQKLNPKAIIELYELDGTAIGAGIFRFHSGVNELNSDIVWQGNTYIRFPIEVTGFEVNGQGQFPRPKLKTSNYLSTITTLLMSYSDLIGAKLTRKRTIKKYLDAVNFVSGNPTADPTAKFQDDIYFIDRKVVETRDYVEFELASSIDLTGVQLPRRQIIQNLCPFVYKGSECAYNGTKLFKADDSVTTNPQEDSCGKRLNSCKLRFGENSEINFGGFPGAGLFR